MSQKYDEYLENHRQAVKKAYQWIAAYIPELTDVEATRNIEFHDMSKNTPDEYGPYDDYFYGEQTPAVMEAFNRAWLMHIHRNPHHWQHWVLINDEHKEGTILIEMPYHEMKCTIALLPRVLRIPHTTDSVPPAHNLCIFNFQHFLPP